MKPIAYREAYSYDPKTHERVLNKRDLWKELKAAIDEEILMGREFHEHTERYHRAMEAIRNASQ